VKVDPQFYKEDSMRLLIFIISIIFFSCFKVNANSYQILPGDLREFALHVHLPRIMIIEEEDDFFNDDLYMWFIITRDGLTYPKMTQIYRGYDEGSTLVFNHEDRIISNQPFKQHLIIDYGLIESDGDDIKELKSIIDQTLRLLELMNKSQAQSQIRERLLQEARLFMSKLLDLNNDDRLFSTSLNITYEHTLHAWENQHFYEELQEFRGQNNGSDWHYQLAWRFFLVDITPSALFLGSK